MSTNKLTDTKVRAAKAADRPYKLADGEGMYLLVSPAGGRSWKLKYRLNGLEKSASLGQWPDVSLQDARERRTEARRLIAAGRDPVEQKRAAKAAVLDERRSLFADAARGYLRKQAPGWSANHTRDVTRIIEGELVPALGRLPVTAIKVAHVRKMLEGIEARGALTYAKDVRLYFRKVLQHYGTERERMIDDPSVFVTLTKPPKEKHHPALPLDEVGTFLRKLQSSPSAPMLRIATRLLLHTAVRTTELREARWSEVDETHKLWRIPEERMKAGAAHVVPLSPQVLALLAELRLISGDGPLLLPHAFNEGETISENTILAVIKRLGYRGKMTGHGARTLFSNWANTVGHFSADAIERQLAHSPRDKVRAAYLSADFLPERVRMMRAWSQWLDEQERGAVVLPFPAAAKP